MNRTLKNLPTQYSVPQPPEDTAFDADYMIFICKDILSKTDFTQLPDTNIKNVDEFAIYRSEIRRILFLKPKTLVNLPNCPIEVRA